MKETPQGGLRPIRGMTVLIPKSAMLGEPSVGTLVKQGNETYKVNEVGGRDRHEVAWRLGCVEPIRGAWCLAENGCAAQDEGGDRCAAEEAGGGAAGDAGHDGDGNPAGGEGVREDGDRDHASGQRGHDGCGREEARGGECVPGSNAGISTRPHEGQAGGSAPVRREESGGDQEAAAVHGADDGDAFGPDCDLQPTEAAAPRWEDDARPEAGVVCE